MPVIRRLVRLLLALFYTVAGYFHLSAPAPFVRIVPSWVPAAETVVLWTGVAELAGAAGLIQTVSPRLRRVAGIGLAAYALCVWPANVNHMVMDLARADHGWGLAYHVPRMFAQPLLIWAALWAGEVTDWPFARRARR